VVGPEIDVETATDDEFDIRALHFAEQVEQRRLKVGYGDLCCTA
jgi:hypothetical protein